MNDDLLQLDAEHVWHPFDLIDIPQALAVDKAYGAELYLKDGRIILDAIASWWVNIHGHAHPVIAKAISEQAQKLEHVIFAGFTHQPAVELAATLAHILPGRPEKIFFSDNGSTAVEVAIKIAFQYWHNKNQSKTKIIAFENAYHGDTFGAMSVGARSKFNEPFAPFLFDVDFIPTPNTLNINELLQNLESICNKGDIAAFIFEPLVQGAAGMLMYEAELLDKILAVCKKYEVILIADEVMTGFGRTGKLFACDFLNIKPDITCLSKGITGGFLPLGVTACKKFLYDAFVSENPYKVFFHGHSYTGNPVACAAANASLELLLQPKTQKNIQRISENHAKFLEEIKNVPWIENSRMQGTILAITLKTNEKSGYFNSLNNKLYDFFLSKNILLRPLGNVIYILPPYVITNSQLQNIYEALKEFGEKELVDDLELVLN